MPEELQPWYSDLSVSTLPCLAPVLQHASKKNASGQNVCLLCLPAAPRTQLRLLTSSLEQDHSLCWYRRQQGCG